MKLTTVLALIFVLLVVSSNCLRLANERTSESEAGIRDKVRKVKEFGKKVWNKAKPIVGKAIEKGKFVKEVYDEYQTLKRNGQK